MYREGLDWDSSDDDVRLAGIIKLYALFQNAQWEHPLNTERGELSYQIVEPMRPSQYGTEELQMAQSEQEARAKRSGRPVHPLLETPLDEIATAMRNPELGLALQTRRWHMQTFAYTFSGSELLDWFLLIYVDIKDRQSAIQAGKLLHAKGLFRSLGGERAFLE